MKIKNKTKKIFFAILFAGLFFSMFFGSTALAGCTKGADCTDPAKPLCNISTGSCMAGSEAAKVVNEQTTTTTDNQSATQFKYTLLESLPGFFTKGNTLSDFPALILAIYQFGIWTVGIAGFFMLVVGGFMYMTSAGNTATAGNAKDIIWDALLGIVAALGAYLILYVINPELTKINIAFTTVNVEEIGPGPGNTGSGGCKTITDNSNPCSVDNLKKFAQGKGMTSGVDDWATKASGICNAESSGKTSAASMEGKCNGTSFAYGLFQVNLLAHCQGAFQGKWKRGVAGGGCSIKDQNVFEQCKANATNATWNLNKMWELYQRRKNWRDWEVTLNGMCKF